MNLLFSKIAGIAPLILLAEACNGGPTPLAVDASPSSDGAPADAAADAPADATPSAFSFVPASLDFGYVAVDTGSAPMQLTVLNNTNADIPDFALALSGDDTIELTISQTTCTSTLVRGGCKLDLSFSPRAEGDHMMAITAMAPGEVPATAPIHAAGGTAPSPFGTSSSYLDFGTVTVGDTYGQVVTYQNSGTTTLPAVSFMFAGESPDQYYLEDDHCTGVQLAPMATCTVVVVYAPTAWMTPGAAILYGTAENTSELDLRANAGAATTLSISPTNYDFGTVGPAPSANVPFTITNTGTVTATGFAVTIFNAQFSVTSSTCTSVAPGDTCVMNVQLAPTATATGPDGGGMTVYSANASDADTGFTAIAIPAEGVILDSYSQDFGTATVGQTGNSYTFTVTNVGTMATSVALSLDDDAAQFSIAQDNCSAVSLAASAQCTFEIVYAPVSAGGHFARVHATSASNDAIAHLTATATPAEPPLNVSPLSYSYGTLAIGQIPSEGFTIENPGSLTKVPTVTLTGPNADEFAVMNDGCSGTSLVASAMCTVDVWYRPATVGTGKSASLQVTWSTGSVSASLSAGAFEDSNAFVTSDPPSHDFGAVTVDQSASFTFPFTNHGAATSAPVTYALYGPNNTEFSTTMDSCTGAVLANGDSCAVTVVFSPASTGTKHASLQITVADGGDTQLTGTGQ